MPKEDREFIDKYLKRHNCTLRKAVEELDKYKTQQTSALIRKTK
jgi:hypothetical protein